MFSGIVKGVFPVISLSKSPGFMKLRVSLPQEPAEALEIGASVSIDGVCLTVTSLENGSASFDVVEETLRRTTLGSLEKGGLVNVERSLKYGDEVGGHPVSGHIFGTCAIHSIENHVFTFSCPREWMKYLLPKGYVALNGVSLTIADPDPKGLFSIHFIPETLRNTTFGQKKRGDLINLEIDSATQAIVDTVERHQFSFANETPQGV